MKKKNRRNNGLKEQMTYKKKSIKDLKKRIKKSIIINKKMTVNFFLHFKKQLYIAS